MNALLKIGELAKLMNTSTSSIRFYEKEGLIKPNKIDTNGYRLYDFEQLDVLEMIMLFRDLDVPINTIKDLILEYNTEKYERIMNEGIDIINKEIKMLKTRKSNMQLKLKKLQQIKVSETLYKIVSKPQRTIIIVHSGKEDEFSIRDFYMFFETYKIPTSIVKEDIYSIQLSDDISDSGILLKHIPKAYKFDKVINLHAGNYLEYGCFIISKSDYITEMEKFKRYLIQKKINFEGPIVACEKIKYHEYDLSKSYIEFQVRCI
jgi:DNA-binding transcriptional MerR regulator